MRDQFPPVRRFRPELALGEVDVLADREGAGAQLGAQPGGVRVRVDPHATKIGAKTGLHEAQHTRRQRRAAGGAGTQFGQHVRIGLTPGFEPMRGWRLPGPIGDHRCGLALRSS
jgi:hypothetical protein